MSLKLYRVTCEAGHVTHQSKLRPGCMVATATMRETGQVVQRCGAMVIYLEVPNAPVQV